MADGSKIEWLARPGTKPASWNPIRAVNKETGGRGHFCVHVSDGCKNCYAERLQVRFRNPVRYAAQDRDKVTLELDEKILTQPLRWREPRTIFVCSMTDLFLEDHSDEWIDRVFAVMALCPQHTFLVLTKRAGRMRDYVGKIDGRSLHPDARRAWLVAGKTDRDLDDPIWPKGFVWPLPNVWNGVSVEDQKTADERIPLLLKTPAAKRWISAEPLLTGLDLERGGWSFLHALRPPPGNSGGWLRGLDWVVAGGESGPDVRLKDYAPFYALCDQCKAAGVPFFLKQMPGKAPIPDDLMVREWPA